MSRSRRHTKLEVVANVQRCRDLTGHRDSLVTEADDVKGLRGLDRSQSIRCSESGDGDTNENRGSRHHDRADAVGEQPRRHDPRVPTRRVHGGREHLPVSNQPAFLHGLPVWLRPLLNH